MKLGTISILGSTGSIGRQTLSVAEHLGVSVCALTANENVDRMEQQARAFRPKLCVMGSEEAAEELKKRLSDLPVKVMSGMEGLIAAATMEEAQVVITAVMGMVGLRPTLAAIAAKKRIGLANKETLVCAGELVMAAAENYGAEIVPVDSEHSAIFQCLMGCNDRREIKRLILTASGGPFYGKTFAELEGIKKEDAFRHPTWTMGQKITIDSATMMNKGLEVIEAMRLYHLPKAKVDVVVHPKSIIHSLVEFCDGAIMAQLGVPDMRIPIQLALTYPNRMPSPTEPLDLLSCGPLQFLPPDDVNFPCLRYAVEAAETGGTACAVLSGANEAAVDLFLRDQIGFNDIPRRVRRAMDTVPLVESPTLEDILEADRQARACVYDSKE
ncbi:MAG: 1-deoxy-D-xylulose-5-phosphate reductoisomerase [Oscillospiraceae bacterium]|nr:1-deoxy-D-xylulose-5-phosphate reductoisomerase [Oscillospiraceae bacterium]